MTNLFESTKANASRYVPLLGIGRGGMGRIDLALAVGVPGAEQLVVLKRLLEAEDGSGEERASLLREARISALLTHPNVVATLGLDVLDSELVLVLEYLEGASLAALSRSCTARGVSFPRRILLRVLRDVLTGLTHAHDLRDDDGTPLGIVHRDMSPSNVIVTLTGLTKVLDFGIAKAARSQMDTPPGLIKGTLGYMAPEQILGRPTDRRADVYAVGVMLWEALTRRRFSASDSVEACLSLRLREELPNVRDLAPDVPAALEHIVQRCLTLLPETRWATASALKSALDEYAYAYEEEASTQEVATFVDAHFGGLLDARRRTLHERMAQVVPPRSTPSTGPFAVDCGPQTSEEAPTASALVRRPRPSKLWAFAAGLAGAVGSCCVSSLPSPHAATVLERPPHVVVVDSAKAAERTPRGKEGSAVVRSPREPH